MLKVVSGFIVLSVGFILAYLVNDMLLDVTAGFVVLIGIIIILSGAIQLLKNKN